MSFSGPNDHRSSPSRSSDGSGSDKRIAGALTIGNFDGVHLGHRSLIKQLITAAKRVGGPATVLTFDPPPLRLLRPEFAPAPLTTNASKSELLLATGVDNVITLNTTPDLLQLDALQFFEQIVVRDLQAKTLIEGENFRFGKNRSGDIAFLERECHKYGIELQVVTPELIDGQWISSTRIRNLIGSGEIEPANQCLSYPYRIAGIVTQGSQRGRTLGFPTANLESIPVLTPAPGVYAARVRSFVPTREFGSVSPESKAVALHIGPNPTFGEATLKVEAHILDYSGDLYGSTIELEILRKIRGVQKFHSKDELLMQLNKDIDCAKVAHTEMSPSK